MLNRVPFLFQGRPFADAATHPRGYSEGAGLLEDSPS